MTTPELDRQVALVTGGSGGIGRAIIAHLCRAGAQAWSLDVKPPQDEDARWIATDMRDDDSVAAAVAQIDGTSGRVDILIHAAGISSDHVVWKLPLEEWDRVHAVNLRGAFLLLRHGIPALRKSGGGRVILIGSINGSRGKAGTSAYSSSKAGLIGLARSVARETGRHGIRVNVIEPGWVRTPLTDRLPKDVVQTALGDSLVGRLLEPDDVARAVMFLCGPGGEPITGQVLRVDGGQFLGGW
jgi:NAD(P)-dependent dehydrogenase (short-subunit alcohol dehydrogenase family)